MLRWFTCWASFCTSPFSKLWYFMRCFRPCIFPSLVDDIHIINIILSLFLLLNILFFTWFLWGLWSSLTSVRLDCLLVCFLVCLLGELLGFSPHFLWGDWPHFHKVFCANNLFGEFSICCTYHRFIR
jgi:hypothetical protein